MLGKYHTPSRMGLAHSAGKGWERCRAFNGTVCLFSQIVKCTGDVLHTQPCFLVAVVFFVFLFQNGICCLKSGNLIWKMAILLQEQQAICHFSRITSVIARKPSKNFLKCCCSFTWWTAERQFSLLHIVVTGWYALGYVLLNGIHCAPKPLTSIAAVVVHLPVRLRHILGTITSVSFTILKVER